MAGSFRVCAACGAKKWATDPCPLCGTDVIPAPHREIVLTEDDPNRVVVRILREMDKDRIAFKRWGNVHIHSYTSL